MDEWAAKAKPSFVSHLCDHVQDFEERTAEGVPAASARFVVALRSAW